MESGSRIIITRGLIGQWASFVGAAGILTGILALVWQGGLSQIVGAAFAIGIISIITWAIMTPREFVEFITGRQVRAGTAAVFSTLLFTGIIVMLYIFLSRAVITLDMTQTRSFTLSDQTITVLDTVRRPVRITGFYSPNLIRRREVDDQFFRLYEVASNGLITRNYVDPEAQPAIAGSFGARDGDVFISYLNEDGTVDFNSLAYVPLTGTQERDMTQAISRLLISGSITVYYELSLGELDPLDNTQRGLSIITQLMRDNGLIPQPLNLLQLAETGGSIPRDASAIIMARPLFDPPAEAIAILDEYLNGGGALFIMADAQTSFMTEGSPFNEYMWENYGLRMIDAVVVDEIASGATPLDIISAAIFDSQISASIDPANDPESATQFRVARPIEVNEDPPVSNGRIIMSSMASYGERNLQDLNDRNVYTFDANEDLPGPLTTVAFAHDTETGAKILLVGDSDFVTNGQVRSPLGNAYLFADGLGWMTTFNERVTFTPQPRITGQPLIFVSSGTLNTIALITVVLMPGSVLLLGIAVWFVRSRR